ncbi:MAG TPA: sensor histidine kinase [Thermoanaerobaculia bacterium]|nr:sensor histidine kinase [Thermoanaerobaculia bacterium]
MTRARIAVFVFVAGTVTGLYFAIQAYWNPSIVPPLTWAQALGVNLTYYYLWALTTPVVIGAARRFRFESGRWGRAAAVHVATSVVLTALQIVAGESILTFLGLRGAEPFRMRVVSAFIYNFQSSLPTYWLILFAYLAFDYYVKYRDRELRGAQLAGELTRAQLQALKMQLKPHFLFNTLNSISSLMYSDVESADAMLARLSDFLRLTLDRELDQEVTLQEELEFVRRYLEIEKIRFEQRLLVSVTVADDIEDARVPTLVLQPLVENAIHHGIAPRPEGGSIAISAQRQESALRISVADDGIGILGGAVERIGLANTRARLQRLYGDAHRFSFTASPAGGFVVEMVIPFHTAAWSA